MSENEYNFPFQPYDIQKQLMKALYECIENGNVGVFESPTGTGKSLSLICSSLTWLRHHQTSRYNASIEIEESNDDPDWMIENLRQEKRQQALQARDELRKRLTEAKDRIALEKQRYENGESFAKRRKKSPTSKHSSSSSQQKQGDAEFLLEEYDSDDHNQSRSKNEFGLSKETQNLMDKLGLGTKRGDENSQPLQNGPKILYASRTHSQLSQFANELKKINLPPIIPDDDDLDFDQLKYLTLGSRKNLCINPKVNNLKSVTAINEKCQELQKPTTASERKCSYIPNKSNEYLVSRFRDSTLSGISDIENLGQQGKNIGICPYYASRSVIPESEVISIPYPLLLQKQARESLDIPLKDNVIIIDEAHNLIEAICGINSCSVSLSQLKIGITQLTMYLSKFNNRLKGKNRIYLAQIIKLIRALIEFLEAQINTKSIFSEVQINSLLSRKGIDQINLYKLNDYLRESHLARKVEGYVISTSDNQLNENREQPVLTKIQTFMLVLMNPGTEGKIFHFKEDGEISFNYLLLDPSPEFGTIVSSARSVILAGGTMSPMDDFIYYLFPQLIKERITTLSCGHVVSSENLEVYPISNINSTTKFELTYEKRDQCIEAAGISLVHITSVVPDGIVVFFPSYDYLAKCLESWSTTQYTQAQDRKSTILDTLRSIKPLFHESKSAQTEAILTSYTTAIHNPPAPHHGAILFAVLSGSLSEGINFSDTLGRCIVVLGLPFANRRSPTFQAKLAHVGSLVAKRAAAEGCAAADAVRRAKDAQADWYVNGAMRAVNQAVGRAIRHARDWAAVVLVDQRYATERIGGKLSRWMRDSVKEGDGEWRAEQVREELRKFYGRKINQ